MYALSLSLDVVYSVCLRRQRLDQLAQQLLGLLTGQPSCTDNACVNVTPCKDGSILACSGERITPGVAGVGV